MNDYNRFLETPASNLETAAPYPAQRCEVLSVIVTELYACFSIGMGYGLGCANEQVTDPNDPRGIAPNEALSRGDINWPAFERNEANAIGEPGEVDVIANRALESVKLWASDVNAFYNADILRNMVFGLCNDYFQIGTMVRADTIPAFLNDFSAAIQQAIEACPTRNS